MMPLVEADYIVRGVYCVNCRILSCQAAIKSPKINSTAMSGREMCICVTGLVKVSRKALH